ncbi:putative Zinc finger, C3HC4 type (RING finger) [Trypanosoma cruzi]|nr:putative Zinc finger, C3HC4 type (RING finger) [Trypanosoma cruzi]
MLSLSVFFLFLRLYCAITVTATIAAATAVGEARSSSKCTRRPFYYASECLEMNECAWCCERPIGQQCFDKFDNDSVEPYCSDYAIVTNRDTTCGQLCSAKYDDCESCEMRNWCYFCISTSTCQPPYASCRNGEVIQSCKMREKEDGGSNYYFTVTIGVGGALMVFALIAALILLSLQLRRREQDEQQNFFEEGTPFLRDTTTVEENTNVQPSTTTATAPTAVITASGIMPSNITTTTNDNNENDNNTNEYNIHDTENIDRDSHDLATNASAAVASGEEPPAARDFREEGGAEVRLPTPRSAKFSTGEDDSVCFLCLDASPSVTFLPCYHTCCCETCSNKLRPTRGDVLTCPFCRTKIVAMVSLHSVLAQAGLS